MKYSNTPKRRINRVQRHLNIAKTQFCIFSNRNPENVHNIDNQGTKIESELSIYVFGVTFDTDLPFQTHAIDVATRSNQFLYLIAKLKKFMSVEETLKNYKILVKHIFEHCTAILFETAHKTTETKGIVQN